MAGRYNLGGVAKGQKQAASNVAVSKLERMALGFYDNPKEERPHVNLKYFAWNHQCFSEWEKDELKAFTDFIRKLSASKWVDIYRTGGSLGHKTGFGYGIHKTTSLPSFDPLNDISPDVTFFELRVTGEARVHGFRVKDAFFLVWLDRQHDICPM